MLDPIDVWKEASESQRHHDNLYWHTVRHYTGLVSLLAGGAGAAVSIAVLPIKARLFASALLLLLGGIFAFVAWYVVKQQGIYIGYADNLRNITELTVVNALNLDDEIKKEWLKIRQLDSVFQRNLQKQGPVRLLVPRTFLVIGVILVMVFFLEIGIAILSPESLIFDSG